MADKKGIEKKVVLICTSFSIWPHVLADITPYIVSFDAPWIETLSMPHPPLAVFSWDVSAASLHCIQEVHLIMWMAIVHFAPPGRKTIPQWDWGKESTEEEKGKLFSDGLQTNLWLHVTGGMLSLSHAITNVLMFPPTCSLSASGTSH